MSHREEFAQRLSELADIIKLMDIADDLLPDGKKTLNKAETLIDSEPLSCSGLATSKPDHRTDDKDVAGDQ